MLTTFIIHFYGRFFDNLMKAEVQKKLEEETIPGCLEKFEKLLKNNKGGDGYFVGDGVRCATILLKIDAMSCQKVHVWRML